MIPTIWHLETEVFVRTISTHGKWENFPYWKSVNIITLIPLLLSDIWKSQWIFEPHDNSTIVYLVSLLTAWQSTDKPKIFSQECENQLILYQFAIRVIGHAQSSVDIYPILAIQFPSNLMTATYIYSPVQSDTWKPFPIWELRCQILIFSHWTPPPAR